MISFLYVMDAKLKEIEIRKFYWMYWIKLFLDEWKR